MDLGTVKSNLKSDKYTSVNDCLSDIQLIWSNCKTYNMQGSEIWKLAVQLEKLTAKLVEKNIKVNGINKKPKKDEDNKEDEIKSEENIKKL